MSDTRNNEIVARYRAGEMTPGLAAAYGLTRQRVFQILQRLIPAAEIRERTASNRAVGVPWDSTPGGYERRLEAVRLGALTRKGLWTTDQDATLRQGAAAGLSFSEVGALVGKSRNSVAGRAYRLGVVFACDHLSEISRANINKRWHPELA